MLKRNNWMRWALAATALLLLLAWRQWGRPKETTKSATFVARRGDLEINVLQGGGIEALESQAVKCEVRGYQGVKILKLVEEGYQVTDDDVRTNKVLVELDSSELKKQILQQDITFESTAASLTDAKQAYDIQLNQNVSDVNAALQKAKFARMDFDKFMGDQATKEIISELGLPDELDYSLPMPAPRMTIPQLPGSNGAAATNKESKGGGDLPPLDLKTRTNASAPSLMEQTRRFNVNFVKYTNLDLLGDGEAKQKIRKLEDDLQVAHKGYSQSKTKLEGTERLYAKGFVTKTELELDEYFLESDRIKVASAETARALFLKYEFPKSCEEYLSKYVEAVRELERARKGSVSKLAQAEAKWKSAEGRYNLEVRQRKDLLEQIDKCQILAKKTGLVVYGGGNMEMYYYGGQEQVREGALVREQQPILTIPDMTKMAVKVRIHETYIKKVQKGQPVRIMVEAFPDKKLMGEVSKVGVLPDSRNMWMNPDMKVYVTTITINGVHDWLKPGMSVKVEIMVKTLPDVVYVPIQAIQPVEDKHYCLVEKSGKEDRREVKVGEFNDEFIEVIKGISAGERVVLRAADAGEKDAAGKNKAGAKDKEKDGDTKEKAAPEKPVAVSAK